MGLSYIWVNTVAVLSFSSLHLALCCCIAPEEFCPVLLLMLVCLAVTLTCTVRFYNVCACTLFWVQNFYIVIIFIWVFESRSVHIIQIVRNVKMVTFCDVHYTASFVVLRRMYS